MKYEHKEIIGSLKDNLDKMYSDGWRLAFFDKETQFQVWDREIKKTRTTKIHESFPEWEEFIKKYRKINNKGTYNNSLIGIYKQSLKTFSHEKHMEKLEEYEQHLSVYTTKPPCMVSTYLGKQKRYLDSYETVKVNYQDKWQDEMMSKMGVPQDIKDIIIQTRDSWQATHPTKEVTTAVFKQMIETYYNG